MWRRLTGLDGMTGLQGHSGHGAELPDAVAQLQSRLETLYLTQKTLEREVQRLRAEQPVMMRRPSRLSLAQRILCRLSARMRYRRNLQLVRGCGLFDADWYLATYEDVAEAGLDPAGHFLQFGGVERRSPGPHFDTEHYLHLYPDIVEIGMNPLVHYVLAGWDEKRSIRAGMPHGGTE
jgi:hypothetical protein